MRPAAKVELTPTERTALETLVRSHSCTVAQQRRARIALLAHDGYSTQDIAREVRVSEDTVSKWRWRFSVLGVGDDIAAGLADGPRPGRPRTIDPVRRAEIVATACAPVPDGSGLSGWTLDLIVEELPRRGIEPTSRSSVHRILCEIDVMPHRVQGWLHSTDPLFREKTTKICELYLNPPPGGIVVCFDEKTGIQAIERKFPDTPCRPGRHRREEFEYIRHGTQSLLATINAHTGEVVAECSATRKRVDIERHMEAVAARWPVGSIHVVLDNLNIHHGEQWNEFNDRHDQRFHFHYTPLHASWVNQIELFFGVLSRRSLRRKSFRSVQEQAYHIMAFIDRWNTHDRKPFRWTFCGYPSGDNNEETEA